MKVQTGRGSSSGYKHEWPGDPENILKCPGFRVIDIYDQGAGPLGGWQGNTMVLCDYDHAHQEVVCITPTGQRETWPVNVPHSHGEHSWSVMSSTRGHRLRTETECREHVHHKRQVQRRREERENVQRRQGRFTALAGAIADHQEAGLDVPDQIARLINAADSAPPRRQER